MLEQFTGIIIQFIQSTGYLGVFFLMTLGTALIPVPSEVVLPFAGFLTSKGVFSFPVIVIVAALGDLTGSLIGYGIGYFLEEAVIVRLIKSHGKYLLLNEEDYRKAVRWFDKYGNKIVLIGKLLPGLRYLISLPAGAVKMNLKKFSLYTLLGALIWSTAMVYIGVYFGDRWDTLGPLFSKFRLLIIIGLIGLVVLYLDHKLKFLPRRKKSK